RVAARIAAGALLFAGAVAAAPTRALDTTVFRANYVIAVGGIVVGHASAQSRFTDAGYVASVSGSTSGVSRIVSDASAKLSGSGRIAGGRVIPSSYVLDTRENGFVTHVTMGMRGGRVTDLVAMPRLSMAPDRVPLTPTHKTNVVDPLGAFIVPFERPGIPAGRTVCNRTIKVFDGWTRFDVQLYYKETKAVDGGDDMYAVRVIVCGARYVPVAGHRTVNVRELAGNERLEVWLVPLGSLRVLVPYRLIIGTRIGDIVITSTRFSMTGGDQRASAE
ncbi:MAG TPA: DUF3108 domain-containing protein, partial [Bauldia sp.]|nr:DUF3108 domain-containing protein [Bauldia sp.]